MDTSELLSGALDGAVRKGKGRRLKGVTLAVVAAGLGFAGNSQLQHNADADRRVGALEQVTSAVRAQAAATAANVEWLVQAHGGRPMRPAPGPGTAAPGEAVPALSAPDLVTEPAQP